LPHFLIFLCAAYSFQVDNGGNMRKRSKNDSKQLADAARSRMMEETAD
jgi:hypothetical protein